LAAALGWRFFVRAGHRAAANFREALATDARLAELSREVTFSVPEESVVSLVLPESSPACGLSVGALNIRAKTGAVVVEVVRGGDCRRNIGADFTLAGGDVLTVIADGRQRAELKSLLGVVSE
ncbi:MAG: TrkA C-terminal domain-containing protein, partial [Kiritimatiellae bacterium]|nr:TrkA C-terminal domain-containing protein [Kiritimatiellia bacterium]